MLEIVLKLQGYSKNDEYVITQHPLTDTTNDFWHMVWDQNSVTIVLLSASDATVRSSFVHNFDLVLRSTIPLAIDAFVSI